MATMQRLVVLLACHALTAIAQDTTEASSYSEPSSPTCTVAGVTWSSGFTYLTGRSGVYPSIYANCENGVPTCYRQTRMRDTARVSIKCDESEIHQERRRLGIYMPKQDYRWPQGVICYAYEFQFNAQQREVFTKAMDEYHQKTAIRFMTLDECKTKYGAKTDVCGGCKHAFRFIQKDDACYATIGYQAKGDNVLNFGQSCFNGGGHQVAVHELGHVTGLAHEHTHPERQVIVLANEIVVSPDNYEKNDKDSITPYDRMSVMHYGRYAGLCVPKNPSQNYCDVFQQKGQQCVVPSSNDCDKSQDNSFGTSPGLAESDIATLAKMYGGKTTPAPSPSPKASTPAPTPPPTQAPEAQVETQTRITTPPATTLAPTPTPPAPSPSTPAPSSSTNDCIFEIRIFGTTYRFIRDANGSVSLRMVDGQGQEVQLGSKNSRARVTSTTSRGGPKGSDTNQNTKYLRQSVSTGTTGNDSDDNNDNNDNNNSNSFSWSFDSWKQWTQSS